MDQHANVFLVLSSLVKFVLADVESIRNGTDQHVFVSKVMLILQMFAGHVQQVQSHSQTKTHANAKVQQFSMTILSDVFNFINVLKIQLESLKVEFIDVSVILTSILILINVFIAQHQDYGIQLHKHVIVLILLLIGMEKPALHVDLVKFSILYPDFVNVFHHELSPMDNANAQIILYGMKQLKIVSV